MVTLLAPQVEKYHKQESLFLQATEHNLVVPQNLKEWTNEVANWPRVKGKWMPYDEINANGEKQLMRTENFADYHEGFGNLLFGDAIADILKQLSGDV